VTGLLHRSELQSTCRSRTSGTTGT
jgi:hypothetical protein